MNNDNRISATMSAADITDILAAIQVIYTKAPWLLTLTNAERKSILKLGEKTIGFHEKAMAYMVSNPEFLPGFIQMSEVAKDNALNAQIMQFLPQLRAALEAVSDSQMIVGSELLMADLAYYQSVHEAAKRGRPGAETIYNDLKSRFPGANAQPAVPPAS